MRTELCQNDLVGTRAASKSVVVMPPVLTKDQQHLISRAISDPTRFEIFRQIAAGCCIACTELREHLVVTPPTVSHHLKELENAGLIESTRAGKSINLTLRRDVWQAYLKELNQI